MKPTATSMRAIAAVGGRAGLAEQRFPTVSGRVSLWPPTYLNLGFRLACMGLETRSLRSVGLARGGGQSWSHPIHWCCSPGARSAVTILSRLVVII